MATKEAGIKLTLTASGFTSGLNRAEGEVGKSGTRMGKALTTALSAGVKGGVDAVRGMFSTIKSTISTLGGIAGGIGFAELARGAQTTNAQFRKLAFDMRESAGAAADFRTIQDEARASALKWGQETEKLGQVMDHVFHETGDAKFARETIDTIAAAASGAHQPVEKLGDIAGTLNEKFGITKDELGDTLAAVVSLSNKGGIEIDGLSERLGVIGAVAKEAGLSGKAGFEQVISLMNLADISTGSLKKGIVGVSGILETLGTKQSRVKVAAQLGIDPTKLQGDAKKQIETILQATKGSKEKLEIAFGGESLKILADLGAKYSDTFKTTSGDVKTKTAAATAALDAAFKQAGKAGLTFADLQTEAANELKSPEKQMTIALEKLKAEFAKPALTDAIVKLMSVMPKLADAIASVVGFAVDHPAAAGTLAVAGVAAKGFGESAIASLLGAAFRTGGATAANQIGGAITSSAATAGTGLANTLGTAFAAGAVAFAAGMALRHVYNEHEKAVKEGELKELDQSGTGQVANKTNNEFITYGRDENGQIVAKHSDVATLNPNGTGIADAVQNMIERMNGPAQLPGETLPPVNIQGVRGGAPEGMSAENARLLADMLGAKKLRVEVTNASEIGNSGGGAPGTPPPGNAPRR